MGAPPTFRPASLHMARFDYFPIIGYYDYNKEHIQRMVRLLVAHGADVNIADKGGNTPTAIARGTAKDLLESLGGK